MSDIGLKICYTTAHILKEQFPNEIMKITPTTIIEYSKKNSRLLRGGKDVGSMSGCNAYFTRAKPHRIVIKQKILKEQVGWCGANWYSLNPIMENGHKKYYECNGREVKGLPIYGNWALVDLICHELSHHRTKGHAKGFKIKYKRFRDYMTNQIISGKFYQRLDTTQVSNDGSTQH